MALQQGVTYIELRARLDQLQRDFKQAETMSTQTGTQMGGQLDRTFGTKMQSVGQRMTRTLTPAAIAFGAASMKAFNEADGAMDALRAGTGATGKELERLTASMKRVGSQVTQPLSEVGTTMAEVYKRTGATGTALEELTRSLLDLNGRLENTASVETVTRVFGDWSVATKNQSAALDALFRASQATGPSVDALGQMLVRYGAPLRAFGFGFEEAAVLLGKFEKEGVNTQLILSSLRVALSKMAKEGIKDPAEALELLIQRIKDAGTEGEATSIAFENFGSRAGADMARAIREGRFEVGKLFDTVRDGSETIEKAADDTVDWTDKLKMFTNRLIAAGGHLGEMGFAISGIALLVGPAVTGLGKIANAYQGVATMAALSSLSTARFTTQMAGGLLLSLGKAAAAAGVTAGALFLVKEKLDDLNDVPIEELQAKVEALYEQLGRDDVIPVVSEEHRERWEQFVAEQEAALEAEKELSGMTKQLKGNLDKLGQGVKNSKEEFADFARLSNQEMTEWRETTISSLVPTGKEFTKLGEKANLSADDIERAIRKMINAQVDFRENWKDVARVAGKQTDDLVNFIEQKLGISAPRALQVLASSSDREIKTLVRGMKDYQGEAGKTARVVENSMKSLAGKLRTAGRNAATGLANGLRLGAGDVAAAGLELANAAVKAIVDKMDIRSPSKLMEKIGEDISLGLAQGIEKRLKEVLAAQEKIVAGIEKKIDRLGGTIDRIRGRISSFRDDVKGAFSDFSVGSAFQDALSSLEDGQTLTPGAISSAVSADVRDASVLANLLMQLASAGLSKANLAQLAAMGSDAIPIARAILAGGEGMITDLNRATSQINSLAGGTAESVTGTVMKDQIRQLIRLEARLAGLRERLHDTNQFIRQLTRALDRLADIISTKQSAAGGGGSSGAGSGLSGAAGGSVSNLVSVGKMLQSAGYRVGEHPSFGGVSGGHETGSYHYAGRAIDVNWGPAGESAAEKAKLTSLGRWLAGNVSPIAELLGPWNDPVGHGDHLHLAMDRGGIVTGPATVEIGNIREAVQFTPLSGAGAQPIPVTFSDPLTAVLEEDSAGRLIVKLFTNEMAIARPA